MLENAQMYREEMVEKIAETDDDLMTMYLEGEEIGEADLRRALRHATINVEIIPVLCGSAYKNKGAQRLLDAVIAYMPAPTDVPDIKGIDPDT
jgi:elongation factor G